MEAWLDLHTFCYRLSLSLTTTKIPPEPKCQKKERKWPQGGGPAERLLVLGGLLLLPTDISSGLSSGRDNVKELLSKRLAIKDFASSLHAAVGDSGAFNL